VNLAGARVLLTGGAGGIGRHLLARLREDGAEVVVMERDETVCAALHAEFGIRAIACDLGDDAAIAAALHALGDSDFGPDVLIHGAGLIHSEPLVNLLSRGERVHSRENWSRVMSANLHAVFLLTSRVVEGWLARRHKGAVVAISSIAAQGNAGQTAYAAAKAGVNAMTLTWAKELGPLGLRFVAIAPGFIDTPSTRAAISAAALAKMEQQIPLRRLGDPEAIYLAVRYSIENDYLSGTVLEVDGGLSL
jgi:3-oxoacyl-[acyl-carrier protein] reductase